MAGQMRYRVVIDGFVVEAADEEALFRAIDRAKARGQQSRRPGLPPRSSPGLAPRQAEDLAKLRSFLTIIQSGGTMGVSPEELSEALETTPKGLGGFMGLVYRCIDELGFKAENVFQRRATERGRRWFAGTKIADALALIDERIEGG